jgi:hypothetical protein
VTRRRVEFVILALALASAALFAALWVHARSSHVQREGILVIDLGVAKNADVNMPYPIHILDHSGREFAGFDHHGIPQALAVPANRYPVVVEAGFRPGGCRAKVAATGEAVVQVELTRRGCVAWQIY